MPVYWDGAEGDAPYDVWNWPPEDKPWVRQVCGDCQRPFVAPGRMDPPICEACVQRRKDRRS